MTYIKESNVDKESLIKSLVDNYSDMLYQWAVYRVSDEKLAEDLVQDTFLAAIEGLEKFKGTSAIKTWLFGILNNKIASHYRDLSKNGTISMDDGDFSMFTNAGRWKKGMEPSDWKENIELIEDESFHKVLQFCLKNLPEKWSAILIYKYVSNRKGTEICQDLEITNTNYWQILHRAKLKMRECLESKWFKLEQ